MSCKPPLNSTSPWASDDVPLTINSTYADAYGVAMGPPRPPQAIKPKPQHDWSANVPFEGRTTSHDAYSATGGGPPKSFKPNNAYVQTPWNGPITTTHQTMFSNPGVVTKAKPFKPARATREDYPMDTRTTAQDSYQPFSSQFRREACYPAEAERVHTRFDHTSTSRASYTEHAVSRYVPAKKPVGALGKDGGLN
eukprot:CAMPEP_0174720968 /NCGR_PEP_ID=MMETSP1094-20130205/35037_1 /TAXON_ID=156173 /ORGANISM="Chrysochromulina brevifilum, Strain UTEX LB 985" /LENGTH=194 /DNA_ID=CAMNT_0015921565 /DNA_START=45 /DNA_END=629 /DNA_ORIENTATION=+